MTVKEFEKKSKDLERAITTRMYDIVAAYAGLTMVSQISNRVIDTQTNAKESKFSRYSDKPVLSSGTTDRGKHVWNALASSKTKRRQLEWVTYNGHRLFVVPGGYAEIRRLSGELNTNKNFFWTGEMWKKFGIVKKQRTKSGFRIRLGGRSLASQDKINWNSEREGINIIDVTPEEEKELIGYIDTWIDNEIRKVGLK